MAHPSLSAPAGRQVCHMFNWSLCNGILHKNILYNGPNQPPLKKKLELLCNGFLLCQTDLGCGG